MSSRQAVVFLCLLSPSNKVDLKTVTKKTFNKEKIEVLNALVNVPFMFILLSDVTKSIIRLEDDRIFLVSSALPRSLPNDNRHKGPGPSLAASLALASLCPQLPPQAC